ncbi:UDP-N-acetylmuramoyl-L-alanyl-D-glutamate--2,6-diaminopimelate ligase [Pontiella sp.]|uniref:UDP-N-acetylmuramoyl-L-alanyl-D-glutamate--2, 6-diaminopimelate ligase n=2 Tax=Pontiella sp. TaxID=2837462 RepID=UPI0035625095
MKLTSLLKNIEVIQISGRAKLPIEGIAYDSREIKPGWLFIAVPGEHCDGADYIAEAVANGAAAVVSEGRVNLGADVAHVQVANARRALAEIACRFHGDLTKKMNVVGITGTNGKTTTAFMARDILRACGAHPGLIGTVAYEDGHRSIPAARTTPEAPEIHSLLQRMSEAGCDSVVMEVSSHAIAMERVHGIRFNTVVFTNLTQDHLDFHNDMESYFDVKAELFRRLEKKKGCAAVINIDDPWGRKLVADPRVQAKVLTYGFSADAMVCAAKAKLDSGGTSFKVATPWGSARIRLQLLGRFNVNNALAAIAVGGLNGITLKCMAKTLKNIAAIPGRLEAVPNRKGKKIFVDYAHTDDALKNVLETLREICKGRLVVVFGCGGNRDAGKRAKMGKVAAELADYSIITSDNPRNEEPSAIVGQILEGFATPEQFEVVLDRRAAIEKGIRSTGRKDILLIAGKGHETYQEIRGTVIPFDDRETVKELVGR